MRTWTRHAARVLVPLAAVGLVWAWALHLDGDETVSARVAREEAGEAQPASRSVLAEGVTMVEIGTGFRFTEGPVSDGKGNVYFSDVHAHRIHRWSEADGVTLFREDSGGANGLALDKAGRLVICESARGRITRIGADGEAMVLTGTYGGRRYNKPNDLWIEPQGGIYFSDPIYGRAENVQGGEHVYYLSPDGKSVDRVIDDMVRPNGLVGTPDGKTLYVADHGAGMTWRYAVASDGTLREKTLFATSGSDGMTTDAAGNVYLTTDAVLVYAPSGELLDRIEVPQRPTNLCFAGAQGRTLFVTARTGVFAIETTIGTGTSPRPASSPQSRPSEEHAR